ncbi:MAG: endonuclease III [Candidatus Diapherotrites archaeon]|uniref:Endonuclease III n=1 Tax=Candidatus Iainarchaeum sp. TaxID=3101447 RepID=A0A7K4BZ24_9ARCH|nr:endonuclease III [Candidatus Diapherotrites archaeon]
MGDKVQSLKDIKLRGKKVIFLLKKNYPAVPKLFLKYTTDAQMLCAIILSAQSTDAQVNRVTEKLFKKYKTVDDFASANQKTFEKEIFSTGFYKTKAKNIISCFKIIKKNYGGIVPLSMSDLISLPGVGRKTANLVLASKGIVEGIAVDTHVFRLSKRIGFSKAKTPVLVEKDLMQIFDKKDWSKINGLLISHGRAICTAKKPKCSSCFLNKKKLCKKFDVLFFI